MEQEVPVDFAAVSTSEELQELLFERLEFPGIYGMNWNAFWDTITGIIEMPKVLVLKNHQVLQQKLREDYRLMMECLEGMRQGYPDIGCRVVKS